VSGVGSFLGTMTNSVLDVLDVMFAMCRVMHGSAWHFMIGVTKRVGYLPESIDYSEDNLTGLSSIRVLSAISSSRFSPMPATSPLIPATQVFLSPSSRYLRPLLAQRV